MDFEKAMANFEEKISFIQLKKIEVIYQKLLPDGVDGCVSLNQLEANLGEFSKGDQESLRKFFGAFMKQTSRETMSRKCFYLNMMAAAAQNKFDISQMLFDQDIAEMQENLKLLRSQHQSFFESNMHCSNHSDNPSNHNKLSHGQQLLGDNLQQEEGCVKQQFSTEISEKESISLPMQPDSESDRKASLDKIIIADSLSTKTASFQNEQFNKTFNDKSIPQDAVQQASALQLPKSKQYEININKSSNSLQEEGRTILNEQQIFSLRENTLGQNTNSILRSLNLESRQVQKQQDLKYEERLKSRFSGKENFSCEFLELEDTLVSIKNTESTPRKLLEGHPQQIVTQIPLKQNPTSKPFKIQQPQDDFPRQKSRESQNACNYITLPTDSPTLSFSHKSNHSNEQKYQSRQLRNSSNREISRNISPNSRLGMYQMQHQRSAINETKPIKFADFQQKMLQKMKEERSSYPKKQTPGINQNSNSQTILQKKHQQNVFNLNDNTKPQGIRVKIDGHNNLRGKNSLNPRQYTPKVNNIDTSWSYSDQFKKRKEGGGGGGLKQQVLTNIDNTLLKNHKSNQSQNKPCQIQLSSQQDQLSLEHYHHPSTSIQNQNLSSMEVSQRHVISCYEDESEDHFNSKNNKLNNTFDRTYHGQSLNNETNWQLENPQSVNFLNILENTRNNRSTSENQLRSKNLPELPRDSELRTNSVQCCLAESRDEFIDALSRSVVDGETSELFRAQLENLRQIQREKRKLIDEENRMLLELQHTAEEYSTNSRQSGEHYQQKYQERNNNNTSSLNFSFTDNMP